VSKATVSVALSSGTGPGATVRVAAETRLRVRKAAEDLGYIKSGLALALSSGRTYTVGLVSQADSLSENVSTFNAYQKDVMIAVTCACARAGLRMTTILVSTPGTTTAAEIADGMVDGVILATLRDDELCRDIILRGFPAVTIGSGHAERRVWPDNRGGMCQAVEHLYSFGHQRIVYVGYPESNVGLWTKEERRDGYRDAMLTRGLTPRFDNVRTIREVLAESPVHPSYRLRLFL
jgi:LacI family transcriptional regulator